MAEKESSAALEKASLSQYLLAPLDAIFKAQIHSARSFLNLVLQLGYAHKGSGAQSGEKAEGEGAKSDGKPFYLEFYNDAVVDGQKRTQRIRVPALAAVPITPLAVESAQFSFDILAEEIVPHQQMQSSRDAGAKRPWYLVEEPISIRGALASADPVATARSARIHVEVKVGPAKMPAGLSKFITSLGEMVEVEDVHNGSEDK